MTKEFSQKRKENSPEDRRQGQAIPLCQVPKAEPETSEDSCTLVLPGLPQRDRGRDPRNPSRQQAVWGFGVADVPEEVLQQAGQMQTMKMWVRRTIGAVTIWIILIAAEIPS